MADIHRNPPENVSLLSCLVNLNGCMERDTSHCGSGHVTSGVVLSWADMHNIMHTLPNTLHK